MSMFKKLLSITLALCMLITILPVNVTAAEKDGEIRLTSFTVSVDDNSPISLLNKDSEFNLTMGEKYTFQLKFNRPDEVKRVYVTSAKDGDKMYLEAFENGEGAFVTNGYFGGDSDYIPGIISVEFSRNARSVQENIIWSTLSSPLNAEDVTITTNEPGSVRGSADVSQLIKDEAEVAIDFSVDVFDEVAGTDIGTWLGVYKDIKDTIEDLDKGEIHCITPDQNYAEIGTYVMFLKDASDANKYIKLVLDVSENSSKSLSKISEELSQYEDVISLMKDYVDIQDEKADLRKQIDANPMIPNKPEAYAQVDSYVSDRMWFSTLTTVLPIIVAATGGTMAIPGIIFTAYLKGMEKAADYFWDYRVGLMQGCDPIDEVFSDDNGHGSGWTAITRAYVEENGNVIRESGKYYIAEELGLPGLVIGDNDGNGPSVDVTLCIHGKSNWSPDVYNGSMLRVCDCTYKEPEDGTVIGGTFHGGLGSGEKCKLIIDSGIISDSGNGAAVSTSGSEVIINGGTIGNARSCAINVTNGGKATINGGNITAGVCAFDNSEIVINDGTIIGAALVDHGQYEVWTESGKITVNGGKMITIGNKNGEVVINDGQIGDGYGAIMNTSGAVTVKGGEINGFIRNESGNVTVSGGTITDRSHGIWNESGGTVNVSGGSIAGTHDTGHGIDNKGGIVNILGGTISGSGTRKGVQNDNNGTVTIRGGTIQNGVANGWPASGDKCKLIITGGSINGGLSGAIMNSGETIISSATIKKSIMNHGSGTVKLGITEKSKIEVNGGETAAFWVASGAPDIPTSIEAGSSYTGGVTYYCAPNAQGVKMTIQEAANIDYSQPYVCLVADGVTGGPSTGEEPDDCEHSYSSTVIAPTCTERGYTTYTCSKCGNSYQDSYVDALGHNFGEWVVITPATDITNGSQERVCSRCGEKENSIIPATGGMVCEHNYAAAVTTPTCIEDGYTTYTCSKCGSSYVNNRTSALGHSYSEWVVVTAATATANGLRERACSRCGAKEADVIPATGNSGSSSGSTRRSGSSGHPSGHQITVPKTNGGSVSLSKSNATAGQTVGITVRPDTGYELDTIHVLDKNGNELDLRKANGQYTFTMPIGKVTVNAVFKVKGEQAVATPEQSGVFSDVPDNYWAKDAIEWASANGYMNGTTATTFNPDGSITRQQMWMILARLSGQNPASMAAAREWAMSNSVSDGTSPGSAMTRQQMVTFLYRYCKLKGYEILGEGYLTGFPDIDKASDYARDALAWATDNSIVEGTKEGLLNPTGTATRAQFAVILQRFSTVVKK